jgi:class 3 adenylate cyclase
MVNKDDDKSKVKSKTKANTNGSVESKTIRDSTGTEAPKAADNLVEAIKESSRLKRTVDASIFATEGMSILNSPGYVNSSITSPTYAALNTAGASTVFVESTDKPWAVSSLSRNQFIGFDTQNDSLIKTLEAMNRGLHLPESSGMNELFVRSGASISIPNTGAPIELSGTVRSALDTFKIVANHEAELDLQISNRATKLRESLEQARSEQKDLKADNEKLITDKEELIQEVETFRNDHNLRYISGKVGIDARRALFEGDLLKQLEANTTCTAFVMSIDVRKSTDLMLKAREPFLFADFVTELAEGLSQEVTRRFGVFDKFTGDGILAYFPDFFSGQDAAVLVADAAEACHKVFSRLYENHRRSFSAVLNSTGLGIGIDYGQVNLVKIQAELTVVGTPVVYACRLGGAPAGLTYVNQPAYEILFDNYSEFVDFEEVTMKFKNEDEMLAYSITRNSKSKSPRTPDWFIPEEDK